MARRVSVRKGNETLYALVDDEDYERISKQSWRLDRNGYALGHIKEEVGFVGIPMHRAVLGLRPGNQAIKVDHKNFDTLDNRKHNLRTCTALQSVQHRRGNRRASSRFKGVTLHKGTGRWQASIKLSGRSIYLGLHDTEEEAAAAYDKKAAELFGEFAHLNGTVSA